SGIRFFNEHPAEMLDDNVRIIANCFESAQRLQLRRIIYISSSCVFDNSGDLPLTEESLDSALPPATGYPFSKYVGEKYCKAYYQQHGLAYTIIRPFNVYGVGELPGPGPGVAHVIPDLTAKILRGDAPLEIFGDGLQTRSFTH